MKMRPSFDPEVPGPPRKRAARICLELGFSQLVLHERGLQHFDCLLAVGVGRPQAAATFLRWQGYGQAQGLMEERA